MDWKTIRNELRKVSALADEWSQREEIPAVERDLALEKLRDLYEAIRFAGSETLPAVEPGGDGADNVDETVLPEAIDLGEVLSLDGFPDLEEPAGPIFVEPAAALASESPMHGSEAAAESGNEPDQTPTPTPAVAEPAPEETVADAPEPVTAPEVAAAEPAEESEHPAVGLESGAVETEPEPEKPAAERAPETVEPTVGEPAVADPAEPVVAAPETIPAEASVASEPQSEEAPEPAPAPAPESVVTLDPIPEPVSEPTPLRHGSPTLFGLEDDEVLRHRHKQRVIMSLYDPSPTVERIPEPSRRPESKRASEVDPRLSELHAEPATRPSAIPAEKPVGTPVDVLEVLTSESAPTAEPMPGTEEPAPVAASEVEFAKTTVSASGPAADPIAGSDTDAESTDSAGIADDEQAFEELTVETLPQADDPEKAAAEPEDDDRSPASIGASRPGIQGLQGGAVLGEVINHDVQTLADTIAPPRDVASELRRSEPVTDLRKAIGLNDKFLMIRDLFGGDAEAYDRAVETLNGFEDLDDCMIFIAEHYAWNPNSDGAKLMMELLERKFA